VQLQGFWIDIDKIKNFLSVMAGVNQAAIVVWEDDLKDQRLAVYVTSKSGVSVNAADLRGILRAVLPEFIVPSAVAVLKSLPLTEDGRVNLKRLPAPKFRMPPWRDPRTLEEKALAVLFAEVLGLQYSVGIDDSFFDLGGTSLLGARLMSRIRVILGAELSIRALFEASTPAELAEALHGTYRAEDAMTGMLRLQRGRNRPALFCIHPGGGLGWCYAGLIPHMEPDRPVYGVQARGLTGREPKATSIAEMANDYADQIQAVQPSGPYHLVGWSAGGMIAHAMAVRLQRLGRKVGLLALLDSEPAWSPPDAVGESPANSALDVLFGKAGSRDEDDAQGASPPEGSEAPAPQRSTLVDLPQGTVEAMEEFLEHLGQLMQHHTPDHYNGDMIHFTSEPGHPVADMWRPYVRDDIEEHVIGCTHHELMQSDQLASIADIVTSKLALLDQ
jgi:thioesterase domain-containing protein